MEASPTLRQPLRLSCLRKPPQRLEMFSTTRPWGRHGGHRWSERDGHGAGLEPRDGGSAVTSHLAPKPTDPALSLGLDNATQRAHGTACTQTLSTRFPPSPLFFFSSSSSQTHTPHLYVCLEVEQVDLLPVAAVQGQDVPRLRERERERDTAVRRRGGGREKMWWKSIRMKGFALICKSGRVRTLLLRFFSSVKL